jgi:hypothetical protein
MLVPSIGYARPEKGAHSTPATGPDKRRGGEQGLVAADKKLANCRAKSSLLDIIEGCGVMAFKFRHCPCLAAEQTGCKWGILTVNC